MCGGESHLILLSQLRPEKESLCRDWWGEAFQVEGAGSVQRPWGWSELGCQRSSQGVTVARAERMELGIEGERYGGR